MSHIEGREKGLTLRVDPGDTVGWSLWNGNRPLSAGQTPMWHFADDLWEKLTAAQPHKGNVLIDLNLAREGVGKATLGQPIIRVVCETFRIYPDKARSLVWDPLRTPRLIGAISFMCRLQGIDYHEQPAAIKKTAEQGGAEEFFYTPLHENRHMNDSIRHAWYFIQFGPEGDPRVPNNKAPGEQ